jgi:hypothetical protein
MSEAPEARGSLFDAILGAADRDAAPGVRPLVSFRPDDEPAFLAEVQRRARVRLRVERRGVDHGELAELHPVGLVPPLPHRKKREAIWSSRWMAAEPVLVPELLELKGLSGAIEAALRRRAGLLERGGLARWLTECAPAFAGRFRVGDELESADPERDVERRAIEVTGAPQADLWVKAGRLSTHPRDASLRVRFSFGAEGADDASHDEARHALVAELACAVLPEARAVAGCERLGALLQRFCGRPVRFTQHIAYWNAPHGGAQFHHDAFAEDTVDFMARQLGVAFVQLSGRSLWLALSIEDLASRVAEFLELMAEGELAWVRAELYPDDATWRDARALAGDRTRLVHELGLPHCGRLHALVNRGPEFTALLADCGHAVLLRPGDVLLLPNHGLARTAMHSVFCADTRPTYGLSLALRGM